jgi:hypothetical protein
MCGGRGKCCALLEAKQACGEDLRDLVESFVFSQGIVVVLSAQGCSLRSPQRPSLGDRIDVWLMASAGMSALYLLTDTGRWRNDEMVRRKRGFRQIRCRLDKNTESPVHTLSIHIGWFM